MSTDIPFEPLTFDPQHVSENVCMVPSMHAHVGENEDVHAFDSLSKSLGNLALPRLIAQAEEMTLAATSGVVTYSRKVFIPLTQLCRDVCHYCTFASTPKKIGPAYLSRGEVLAIARAGVAAGCREALFTLGDRPEDRYDAARKALARLGHPSTLSYLREMAQAVLGETGLLPHLNPGLMDDADYVALRPVSASMGLMLETASDRLSAKGGPHHGSPDKLPTARLTAIAAAGRAGVPFTTGLLIGIGETRVERIEYPELSRQARHAHGQSSRAVAGGASLDDRGCPADPGAADDHPGAAQPPPARGAGGAVARGRERLGRGLPGDPRPCEPRGAVAASRCAGGGDRRRRAGAT